MMRNIIIYIIIIGGFLYISCNASGNGIDYQNLYYDELNYNQELRKINAVLTGQNDALQKYIDSLNVQIGIIATIYDSLFSESIYMIDSLRYVISYRDSSVMIMLHSIESSLENISDEGYQYLDILRKK